MGKAISDTDSKTRFQDAVTPPILTTITMAVRALSAALIGWAFWSFGVATGFYIIIVFWIVSIIAGVMFVPKSDSAHWVKMIYVSRSRRVADDRKAGDNMRADAAESLTKRIEIRLADKFG